MGAEQSTAIPVVSENGQMILLGEIAINVGAVAYIESTAEQRLVIHMLNNSSMGPDRFHEPRRGSFMTGVLTRDQMVAFYSALSSS